MQLVLDGGNAFSITWQVLPYALLTLGEVLVSATGLEFAYSQAPPAMKGAIMAFWNLSVTVGNLWVLVVNAGVKNAAVTDFIESTGFGVTAFQMFFFAAFAFAAALAFRPRRPHLPRGGPLSKGLGLTKPDIGLPFATNSSAGSKPRAVEMAQGRAAGYRKKTCEGYSRKSQWDHCTPPFIGHFHIGNPEEYEIAFNVSQCRS